MKQRVVTLLIVLSAGYSMAEKLFHPLGDCHVFQRNNILFLFNGFKFDTLAVNDNIINFCSISDSMLAYITSDGLIHMLNVKSKNEFTDKSIGSIKPKKIVSVSESLFGIDSIGNFYSFDGDEWKPSFTFRDVKDLFGVSGSLVLQLDSAFVKITGSDTVITEVGNKIEKAFLSEINGVYITQDKNIYCTENFGRDWSFSGQDSSIDSKVNAIFLWDSTIYIASYIASENNYLSSIVVGSSTPLSRLILPQTPTFLNVASHSLLLTDMASNFVLTDHSLLSWTFNGNTNGEKITGLAIIDSLSQIAVGKYYYIKTVDRGNMWYPLNLPNRLTTYYPCITSYKGGVLIGSSQQLIEIDSLSRTKYTVIGISDFTAIYATNSKVVIAERGSIFVKNGESPWVWVTNGVPPIGFFSLCFTDSLHGYAGSMAKVFETKDGGLTWTELIPQIDGAEVIGVAVVGNTPLFIGYSGGVNAYNSQQVVAHNAQSERELGSYYYRGIAACGDSAYFVGGFHHPPLGYGYGVVEKRNINGDIIFSKTVSYSPVLSVNYSSGLLVATTESGEIIYLDSLLDIVTNSQLYNLQGMAKFGNSLACFGTNGACFVKRGNSADWVRIKTPIGGVVSRYRETEGISFIVVDNKLYYKRDGSDKWVLFSDTAVSEILDSSLTGWVISNSHFADIPYFNGGIADTTRYMHVNSSGELEITRINSDKLFINSFEFRYSLDNGLSWQMGLDTQLTKVDTNQDSSISYSLYFANLSQIVVLGNRLIGIGRSSGSCLFVSEDDGLGWHSWRKFSSACGFAYIDTINSDSAIVVDTNYNVFVLTGNNLIFKNKISFSGVINAMRYYNGEIIYVGDNNLIGSHRLYNVISTEKSHRTVNKSALLCSPNPFFNSFTLFLEGKHFTNELLHIYVYDIRGRLLYQDNLVSNKKKTISLLSAAAGLYFVKITDGRRVVDNKPILMIK
jgi:hypothetical protein